MQCPPERLRDMLSYFQSYVDSDTAHIKSWEKSGDVWDVRIHFHSENPCKRTLDIQDLGPKDKMALWKDSDSDYVLFLETDDGSVTLYLHFNNICIDVP